MYTYYKSNKIHKTRIQVRYHNILNHITINNPLLKAK